ncbi:S-adenosyl-L-methionine-dependent methyltransferase [Gigaspora margarita]|uniref:S-adenosyl-L-methionine-dependent methyltransferase n=1 Tax=Gigaspora margarita TaxID=4874 RepID=A0A8H4B429_GIGMA|nr:S-adenosyl-L-methionine-dependent methyltransferase [Gigaspora margarita]
MGNELTTLLKVKKNKVINEKVCNRNSHEHKNTNANTGFPVVDCDLTKEKDHHEFLIKIWNSNFYSPVESILKRGNAKVLDVGCGFGTWTYDMANNYTLSHFTGIDVIIPKESVLSNVSFVQADVLDGLKYSDCSFDFIYIRDLLWYITTKDARNKLFPDLLRILKPGGWIECLEYDTEIMNTGPNTQFLIDILSSYFRNHGLCPNDFYKSLSRLFKENKLEYQVEEKIIYFYDAELSTKKYILIFKVVKSVILEYTSINSEQYDEILDKVWAELMDYKTCFRSIRHIAKKL